MPDGPKRAPRRRRKLVYGLLVLIAVVFGGDVVFERAGASALIYAPNFGHPPSADEGPPIPAIHLRTATRTMPRADRYGVAAPPVLHARGMLIGIRRGGPTDVEQREDQPVGLLIACHGRIRTFLDVAARLAGAREEPVASISDAAARVARYFGEALPLHALDEDVSIAPRLIEAGAGEALREVIDVTAREHVVIDEVLASLSPRWIEVSRDPAALAAQSDELAAGAARLAELFDVHLEREERILFPEVARLPEATQAALVGEMRARRGR